MEKILITPRSFGKTDNSAFESIKQAGFEPVVNPYGQIMSSEQMIEQICDCVGVIVGVDPLDSTVLSAAKKLKAIAKYGVGTDNIDLKYCEKNDISVSITQGANSNAVADYTFSLICATARKLTIINDMCHNKNWSKIICSDIHGKSIGILGLGAIGKGIAKRAAGFDMKIFAYDLFWNEDYANEHSIVYTEPSDIFKLCDFISLHLPLTEETANIINKNSISTMKNGAIIINTARGGLIDEKALIEALNSGKLGGAGIDVFNEEPPENQELYEIDNLIMGSHCAASTVGASEAMSYMATQNILKHLSR